MISQQQPEITRPALLPNPFGMVTPLLAASCSDDRVLFAELKRAGRDRIRPDQRLFLETALKRGIPLDAFLIVEWELHVG
jgi:hypothetical protein